MTGLPLDRDLGDSALFERRSGVWSGRLCSDLLFAGPGTPGNHPKVVSQHSSIHLKFAVLEAFDAGRVCSPGQVAFTGDIFSLASTLRLRASA